jgi:hypothetical protein
MGGPQGIIELNGLSSFLSRTMVAVNVWRTMTCVDDTAPLNKPKYNLRNIEQK